MCGAINYPHAFITCMGTTFPLLLHGKLTHCLSSDNGKLSKNSLFNFKIGFKKYFVLKVV